MSILASASQTTVGVGASLGTTLAVVCSWQRNRSLLWALLHGILSWFYVIYFAITRRESEKRHMPQPKFVGRAQNRRV